MAPARNGAVERATRAGGCLGIGLNRKQRLLVLDDIGSVQLELELADRRCGRTPPKTDIDARRSQLVRVELVFDDGVDFARQVRILRIGRFANDVRRRELRKIIEDVRVVQRDDRMLDLDPVVVDARGEARERLDDDACIRLARRFRRKVRLAAVPDLESVAFIAVRAVVIGMRHRTANRVIVTTRHVSARAGQRQKQIGKRRRAKARAIGSA